MNSQLVAMYAYRLSVVVPLDLVLAIDRLSDESGEPVDSVVEVLLRSALISHERMTANRAELVAA